MKQCGHLRLLLSAVLAVALLPSPAARAAGPEDELTKGWTPASETALEMVPEDGGAYLPEAVSLDFVRVGLRYGARAVGYAEFYAPAGNGFRVGSYDEQGHFTESTTVEGNWLGVYRDDGGILVVGQEYSALFPDPEPVAFVAIGDGGDGVLSYRDHSYLGGFQCRPDGEYGMSVINFVGLEDYVRGVIPYEMSPSWPYEALRAQAICARTYAVYFHGKYAEYGFDLTDNTECQVYRGINGATALTDRAVSSTAGQYVRYQGKLCEVYYSASDGGATEDGYYVFGTERPYLAGKTDPFEQAVDYTGKGWVRYFDAESLSGRLQERGYDIGPIASLSPEYTELGNVIAMTYTDEQGRALRLEGRDCYQAIGLNNCRFQITREDDLFVIRGNGWGHNCGMSQWGAYAMADSYGYSCEDIIRFYFTGAYVG